MDAKKREMESNFSEYQATVATAKATLNSFPADHATFEKEMASVLTKIQKCRALFEQIVNTYDIPKKHHNKSALEYIANCFESQTVDSFKEAYNRLMDKQEGDERNNARMRAEAHDRAQKAFQDKLDREERARKEEYHRRNMEYEAHRQSESAAKAAEELRRINEKINND